MMSMNLKQVLLLSAALTFAATAAQAAEIRGQVVDGATATGLAGAEVSAGGVTARSDKDGFYVLRGVPVGEVAVTVTFVGYPDLTKTVTAAEGAPATVTLVLGADEVIKVTGARVARREALQTKKTADNVLEALYSDDIGKLPDQNIAESVRRLPGVSVANDQGEGRYIVVRGSDPNLLNVEINGQQIGAPEQEGRQVKVDGIPTSLVEAVIVQKSLTPDMDANAIAGAVDVQTLSAFDRDEPFFAYGSGQAGYFDLNGNSPWELEGTVGARLGDFGIVAGGNYSRRDFQSHNVQGTNVWNTVTFGGSTFNLPTDFRLRDYGVDRKRGGAVLNLDWRPGNGVAIYLNNFYSRYRDDETRDQFRIELPAAAANLGAGSNAITGTFVAGTRRGTRFLRDRAEDEKILSSTLGGLVDFGRIVWSADVTVSSAKKDDPRRNEWEFRSGGAAMGAVAYDLSNPLLLVTPAAAAYDPATFPFRRVRFVSRAAAEDLVHGATDAKFYTDLFGADGYFQAGAKVTHREKTFNQTGTFFGADPTPFLLSAVTFTGGDLYDGRYRFGPRVDLAAANAFRAANPAEFVADVPGSLQESVVADYAAEEDVVAGFLLGNFDWDRLTLVGGVRVESTEATYKGKVFVPGVTVADPGFNSVRDVSYTDWFPSLNGRYEIMDDLTLRAAYATAIGRPNFEDVNPSVLIEGTNVTLGNAALEPLRSDNFDLGVEWYLPHEGLFSVGYFLKKIDKPIFRTTATVINGTFGGVFVPGAATVSQPLNAREGEIEGIEVGFQQRFAWLPGALDGFGVATNWAYISSNVTVPGRVDKPRFPLQSRSVGTLQVFYEKYGLEARVAYSFRSSYVDEIGASSAQDVFVNDWGQWDARVRYGVTDNFGVFVEGTNLNDEPWNRYVGFKNQLVENEIYGYAVSFGVDASF